MNRRDFIRGALTALAGFTILPGAGRVWKAQKSIWTPAELEFYNSLPFIIAKYNIEHKTIPSLGWLRLTSATRILSEGKLNVTTSPKVHILRADNYPV